MNGRGFAEVLLDLSRGSILPEFALTSDRSGEASFRVGITGGVCWLKLLLRGGNLAEGSWPWGLDVAD